jgi:hypothetical protein
MDPLARALVEHYRCSEAFLNITLKGRLSEDAGFFQLGPDVICYGRSSEGYRTSEVEPELYDLSKSVTVNRSDVCVPFDPTEIISNLRLERYAGMQESRIHSQCRDVYYFLRPVLHRSIRRHIQRFQLRGWRQVPFPSWPVDRTVENLCEQMLLFVLNAKCIDRIPFIWFWPHGAKGCMIMTHDVETEAGKDFCADLMDIDDSFGIKASFQVVPEGRYAVSTRFLDTIRDRGFEIAIQDLNHDGRLFDGRKEFLRRANLINQYVRVYGVKGFRAAVLYRKPDWYDAFSFSYDMSIPNTARLDPQRGGCCTVLPYFIGDILELPVTTTQDYALFHLLGENSIDLWKRQIELIADKNGLISFIIHPDYVMQDEVKRLYKDLLTYLQAFQATGMWVTLPSEVDWWWRARSKMKLVLSDDEWRIEGEEAEHAIVAYARNAGGKLVYEIEPKCASGTRRVSK